LIGSAGGLAILASRIGQKCPTMLAKGPLTSYLSGPDQLKPLAQFFFEVVQENVLQSYTTHTWKGMTFYAVQRFRLSYSD
jgi:hypothetical protein